MKAPYFHRNQGALPQYTIAVIKQGIGFFLNILIKFIYAN